MERIAGRGAIDTDHGTSRFEDLFFPILERLIVRLAAPA
jgi:hypothetical protein